MSTGSITSIVVLGGITLSKAIQKTFDHTNTYGDGDTTVALAAGKAATDWVRTDADTAACNLAAEHGYSSGKMDVYFTAGMRYDVDVSVTTNALTLDGGTGTDFPESADTSVIVCEHQQINTAIDGDAVVMLAINSTQRASCYFEDANGDSIAQIDLVADEPYVWHDTGNLANQLTGDPITVCFVSNGTATAGVVTILSGEDSTP